MIELYTSIELYTANTFNGQRVSIMLEETELPYTIRHIDLAKKEQHSESFLKLNPNAKIPVLVDYDSGSSSQLVLTQSIAILKYLAEKTQQLIPQSLVARAKVFEWMDFHAVDIGSSLFNAFYLQQLAKPKQEQAANQLRQRIDKMYKVFDQQLEKQDFLAGDSYSIADITAYPAVAAQQEALSHYVNLYRWALQIKQRPAVQRGMNAANQK